jgi:hypothetical protein
MNPATLATSAVTPAIYPEPPVNTAAAARIDFGRSLPCSTSEWGVSQSRKPFSARSHRWTSHERPLLVLVLISHSPNRLGSENLELVRSIGADRVIDYTQRDFTKDGQRYDVIFDLVGNHSLTAVRRVLNREGIYIGAGILGSSLSMIGMLTGLIATLVRSRFVSQQVVMLLAKRRKDDLLLMHELLKTGKVRPVIDKCYSLSEVPEAIRHLEGKHARGKIVIAITDPRNN